MDGSLGLSRGDVGPLLCTGFRLLEVGVCIGYLGLSHILTGDCNSLLVLDVDSLVCLGCLTSLSGLGHVLSDLDLASLVGLRSSNGTVTLCVGYVDAGILHCSRCSLLTNTLDIVGVVGDIDYVHVNQLQTDLLELLLDVVVDVLEERVAVLVDLLNGERSDGQTQLTEDYLLGHLLDVFHLQS